MANNGLTDPRLGKRIIAETRLVRYERRIERSIKRALATHKAHALDTIRRQHLAAAAPPDTFGLYTWDTSVDDSVDREIGDVLGDMATGVFNFLALPPATRAQILGELDFSARQAGFVDKVRSIGPDISARLLDTLSVGVGKGEGIDKLTARITDAFDVADNTAERIARTETHGIAEATTHDSATAIANAGYDVTKSWLSTEDDRTRPTHVDADGQTVAIDETFSVGDAELMYPGDPDCDDPGEIVNCRAVVAGTRVRADGLVAVTRLSAKEHVVGVATAAGKKLSASPEHRVMTLRGWVRADRLVPGDDLVCCSVSQTTGAGHPDINDVPPVIEDVWDALTLAAERRQGVGRRGMKLYDSCPHGDVDVVRADEPLSLGLQTSGGQHADKFEFPASHGEMSLAGHGSAGMRTLEPNGVGLTAATGIDSGFDNHAAHMLAADVEVSSNGEFGHAVGKHRHDNIGPSAASLQTIPSIGVPRPNAVGDALGPSSHESAPFQFADPRRIRDMSGVARLLGVHPAQVETDRVLDTVVEIREVQLFDLSTRSGWYVANNIVVHNCSVEYSMGDGSDVVDTTDTESES